MSDAPRRVVFNRYALPPDASANDFYANDQVVQLDMGMEAPRNQRQLRALGLGGAAPVVRDPVFGSSLGWAYREYIVHRLPPAHEAGAPLGNRPPQPAAAADRARQLGAPLVDRVPEPGDLRLCLFNVLAATEWHASRATLDLLAWAFRRASDFLYDATDGRMAFGQVAVGGPELLGCADIQIMASNRLNPRTWVSGLHNELKYMAIRLGRGAWHKNNHVSIAWDEPEAYRTLVHEWSHYALELPDEYLESHHVFLPAQVDAAAPAARLARGAYTLVVPGISLATESIMGTLEGTSELVPQYAGGSLARQKNVWHQVRDKGRYPFLDMVADRAPLSGPGRLPLPLPSFHQLGDAAPEELRMKVPHGVAADHCWVYLLRGAPANPERVIAQGTLDARAPADGFRLLGARPGDTVVLIDAADAWLQVLAGTITRAGADGIAEIARWQPATPPQPAGAAQLLPIVDVVPSELAAGQPDERVARIRVRVASPAGTRPEQVSIFPHGQLDPGEAIRLGAPTGDEWISDPQPVSSLDGHVLLRWADGGLMCYTYSQGGGPATHIPPGPPSISAGSSEGNLMLFFERDQHGRDYSAIRVVTTLVHGMPARLEAGQLARGYAFSIASNAALPAALNPTLVMYFDQAAPREGGDLLIYRQIGDGGWQPVPTYQPAGASFVAMPVCAETAAALLDMRPHDTRIERYRMYWRPAP